VSTIDIDGDSTFVLGLEAERRGYTVWHYTPPELIFRDRKVLARAQPMKLRREVWRDTFLANRSVSRSRLCICDASASVHLNRRVQVSSKAVRL